MYSYNDFERLFLRYKLKVSLLVFLLRNFVCPTKFLITYFPNGTRIPERR